MRCWPTQTDLLEPVFCRYSTALGALIALFIACSLFRDAKCTSVKVIVVCLGGGAVLSLM
jgi:hypothetical protein